MTLRFGTDGIRGAAYTELTTELSFALGQAAASLFDTTHGVFIARDTRESGPDLQRALADGLMSMGVRVHDTGVLPTPAVAHLSYLHSAPAAMISASHNQYGDNGIKFFQPGGKKLSDAIESELENLLTLYVDTKPEVPSGLAGESTFDGEASAAYKQHLSDSFDGLELTNLKVVVDCANGAASEVAPDVLRSFGAEVVAINASPDGRNINADCGSTHPQTMQRTVVERGADVGFAFDGDADRVLASDASGTLVDGDELMGMLALDAKRSNTLADDTLVLTVMSNLGLRLSMENHGVKVHETAVGDRYVLEALTAHGWSLGGEQSGHIIFPALASTGDGLLTALKVLSLMKRSTRPLESLAQEAMKRLPQVLRNVRVERRDDLEGADEVWRAVAATEAELGRDGRVLLRPSGTEPLVRVMVEAPTQEQADALVEYLIGVVAKELG